jgi:hypothetical protein
VPAALLQQVPQPLMLLLLLLLRMCQHQTVQLLVPQ